MDAEVGHEGYPAMGPLADPPVEPVLTSRVAEPGPDYLLSVADARTARAALDAAARLVLVDGRGTAWRVLGRLVWAAWFGLLMASVLRQAPDDLALFGPQTVAVLLAGLPVLAVTTACDRAVGVRPLRRSPLTDVSTWTVCVVVLFGLSRNNADAALGWLAALGVLTYVGAPVWRWGRATRHRVPGAPSWPTGVQAFALLAVLDRADSVAPERLIALAGLDPASGRVWLDRLRSEWAVYGGRRRHWVLGDEYAGLTVPGRQRLDRMRAELERVAARAPAG